MPVIVLSITTVHPFTRNPYYSNANNIVMVVIFKRGTPATGQHAPGFLELLLSANVCMHVCSCMCPPPKLLITSGVI